MSSGAILENKKQIVQEITDKMKSSQSFVFVDYKGINVEQATALREKTREAGVDYKIYKNTFLRFAAKAADYEGVIDCLTGSTAVAFCESDAVAPAKVIADFVKERNLKTLEFKGGVIDGEVLDVASITAVSKLPSREALLSQMLGSLNAPIANFAVVINEIKKQKEAQESA